MQKYKLLKDLPRAEAGTIVCITEAHSKTPWIVKINIWNEDETKRPRLAYIHYRDAEKWLEEVIEKPKSVWDLKEGDKYFYLSEVWDIRIAEHIWHILDGERIQIGNAFLKKDEALKELKKRIAIQKIKKYCWENGIETEYKWENQNSFYLLEGEGGGIFCSSQIDINWNPIGYFSPENAQKILEKFEEELKIILE